MRKLLGGVGAGLVCGVIGAALSLVISFTLSPIKPGSWDWASPVFMVLAACVAGLVFGAVGAYTGSRVVFGDWRSMRPLAMALPVVVAIPVALWFYLDVVIPNTPSRTAPASSREQSRWKEQMTRMDPRMGPHYAHQVESCVASYGAVPDFMVTQCPQLAVGRGDKPHRFRYLSDDNGWRWRVEGVGFTPDAHPSVVVYLDESLGPSEVFEIWDSGVLVRRERQGAPAMLVRSDLPIVERYRQCLLDAAPGAREDGTWSGKWEELLPAVGRATTCRDYEAQLEDPNPTGGQNFRLILQPNSQIVEMRYAPVRDERGGFELFLVNTIRRFMLDRDGRWHARRARSGFATKTDPGPLACELNPQIACDAK